MLAPFSFLSRPSTGRYALLLLCLLLTPRAWGQQSPGCTEALRNAESTYQESNYEDTIRLLAPCLSAEGLERTRVVAIHRLLSMAHMNSGDAHGARLAILDLLNRVPDYEPDPVQDPPSYTVLVMIIRDQLRQQTGAAEAEAAEKPTSWAKRRGTWFAIGGGLLVVGLTAILTGDDGAAD